jgi:ribosome-associated protein
VTRETNSSRLDHRELSLLLARTANEKKAQDIRVIEVGDRIKITEFFVICSGHNSRQVLAIADALKAVSKSHGRICKEGVEGYSEARWVLLDYRDIIVHIFLNEVRQHYDLEMLWGDCPQVQWHTDSREEIREEASTD